MARTYFWAPISGAAEGLKTLVTGKAGLLVTTIATLISAIGAWRFYIHGRTEMMPATRLVQLGIATFLLGNATFLIVPSIAFTSTGIDNRVHVAAALGVSIIVVAALRFASNLAPADYRRTGFKIVVVLEIASAVVRLATIENYWAEAPLLQRQILSAAHADLRKLPPNSTVILDGVCPYHGPAVVFETYWDTSGALTIAMGRPVSADVVSSRMTATSSGLETSIYKEPSNYPYGKNLYIYDAAHRRLVQLRNAIAASQYFRQRSQRACPGYVARGVAV